MSIQIIIADFNAGSGGHTRTALAIAEGLRKQGHYVRFVVGATGGGVLEGSGFEVYPVQKSKWGQYTSVRNMLGVLAPVDVVHIFSQEGVAETVSACKQAGIPCFRTICGGSTPRDVLPMGSIISLSEEVRHGIVSRLNLPEGSVSVLPARIDTNGIITRYESVDTAKYRDFRNKYGVSPTDQIVLRVARLSPTYETSILQGAEAVARLAASGQAVAFVYIGFSQNKAAEARIRKAFDQINGRFDTVVAVWARDEAMAAIEYVPMADVVVGTGRSAFEAMLAKKPTIVVGKNGFAGRVDDSTVGEISWFNFSGRNQTVPLDTEDSIDRLQTSLQELLSDEVLARQLGAFGFQYVITNLDVALTVSKLVEFYGGFTDDDYPKERDLAAALAKWNMRRLARRYLGIERMHAIKRMLTK